MLKPSGNPLINQFYTEDTFESISPDYISQSKEESSKIILEFIRWLREVLANLAEQFLVINLHHSDSTSTCFA